MVIKINFHMHSKGSDGRLTPEQVVLEAIQAKIDFMCFTDHYPAPDNHDPYTNKFFNEANFKEFEALKEKYKAQIDISIGVEFDWIEGYDYWYTKEIDKHHYDFLIGSVHGLANLKKLCSFWNDANEIGSLINVLGSKKQYVQEYYNQVRKMVQSNLFDCVGHLDVIKLKNKTLELFLEEEQWHKEEIEKTLEVIKKSKMCIEINMRGVVKRGEGKQYPSLWILKEAKRKNLPLTIGSDFHSSGENEPLLEQAYNLARLAGYSEIVRFKERKPIVIRI